MQYAAHYESPLGSILLSADGEGLTGLWFEGQKYYPRGLDACRREDSLPALEQAKRWLDAYFSGRKPEHMPPIHMPGTPFRLAVWRILLSIPYGSTTTYKAVAGELAAQRGLDRMSAQAVGGAIAHNAISIIIPCHRVVGSNGGLIGYAGGVDKKSALLRLEASALQKGRNAQAGQIR